MGVRAAGHDAQALVGQTLRQGPSASGRPAARSPGTRGSSPPSAPRPSPAMQCSSGPPCIMGNTALSIAFACSSRHRIIAPRGPRSALWVVNVTTSACGTGEGNAPSGHQPDEVRGVDPQQGADLVGDLRGTPRSRSRAGTPCTRRGRSSAGARAPGHESCPCPGARSRDRLRTSMKLNHIPLTLTGEPCVRCPPWASAIPSTLWSGLLRLQERAEHRHVRLSAGVRLDVRVVGSEQLLRAIDRRAARSRRRTRSRRSSDGPDIPRRTCCSSWNRSRPGRRGSRSSPRRSSRSVVRSRSSSFASAPATSGSAAFERCPSSPRSPSSSP